MNILITGAGGASAISVWKSLSKQYTLFMADKDPCAAGLYLVPLARRFIIPSGSSKEFIPKLLEICIKHNIQILIPTVDWELLPLAQHREDFAKHTIKIPLSPLKSLELCRDKYQLLNFCQDTGHTPWFKLYDESTPINSLTFPCFAKPRRGAGAEGTMVIKNDASLQLIPKDKSYVIQELLPGEEFSVDVYIHSQGYPLAAVPRLRMKIDSGIAVASQTQHNPDLIEKALQIIQKVGIRYTANIQFKANLKGEFKLLEINPRFPGTLPLTAAAGIDIPMLLIKDLSGEPLSNRLLPFTEIMMVRYWTEEFFSIDEWRALCPR